MENDWSRIHKLYKEQDWVKLPTIFAEQALLYFPKTGKILELGAGLGQDTLYFAKHSYEVTSSDQKVDALQDSINSASADVSEKITVQIIDLNQPLHIPDATYDVVYAHLSLHYFDTTTTERIFSDINRILRPGGILAFFTNSVNDPEYNTGTKIENDYYNIEGMPKRYFTVESAVQFASQFDVLVADDKGETYKDTAKGIHNLIRFIGKKV